MVSPHRAHAIFLSALLLLAGACAKSPSEGTGAGGSKTGAGGSTSGTGGSTGGSTGAGGGSSDPKALHVEGNKLVDGTGKTVRLFGVGRQGTEYRCITGDSKSVFQDEADTPAGGSLAVMASWHVNTVRLPLNEDCWLKINGATDVGGDYYQGIVDSYVQSAHAKGFYVIVDLHWNAPGTMQALGQQTMADADHSLDFWKSVAAFWKNDPMILFELYNEPILNQGSNQAQGDPWACWQSGCTTAAGWKAAGMQQLVDAVRGAGATQVLIVNGIEWSNKLDGWLAHKPNDPLNNLAAGFHLYNDVACANAGCWGGALAGVAAQFPVVTGEFGDKGNGTSFASSYMSWADSKGISYIAWSWFVGQPSTPPLLTAWDGTATTWGATVKAHYLQVNP